MSALRALSSSLSLLLIIAVAAPSHAEPKAKGARTPYYQGKTRVSLGGGGFGRVGTADFYLAGAFGVFVIDNLELGLDAGIQFGDGPTVGQLGPQLRYILPLHELIHPYLGAFYRRWFGPDSLLYTDSAGARAGVMVRSRQMYFQIGLVYEAALGDCVGDGCDEWYPEFGVSVLF